MAALIADNYEIVRELGSGGSGTVYLAVHKRLGKKVVMKEDNRELTTGEEALSKEMSVLRDLRHSYIPIVYDYLYLKSGEKVYTVMEYIDGTSLDKPLEDPNKTFSQPEVISWAAQILKALDYLHSPIHGDPPRGYVHSDIKPANIMLREDGSVCLIDFNIALAIGEPTPLLGTEGYASPEHYGLDLSTKGNTVIMDGSRKKGRSTVPLQDPGTDEVPVKLVMPDARSDIYSLGATMYHLLSGKRPPKDAFDVVPLSKKQFSPPLVDIITKAMAPNPDLRYQTAQEMLDVLRRLHKDDPRTKRLKRYTAVSTVLLTALLLAGGACAFTGLRQMERRQAEAADIAQLAEETLSAVTRSEDAYLRGDMPDAVQSALEALSLNSPYQVQAQKALTDALGVYDLSEGFKPHLYLELPSVPLKVEMSPGGTRTGVVVSGQILVFDSESGETLARLPADASALSDIIFRGEDMILYAGEGALRAYDLVQKEDLWSGVPATGIVLSGDGSSVAAVYRDEQYAAVYNAVTGELRQTVSFGGKQQAVAVHDTFTDTGGTIFTLNDDASMLAVSFSDGSLRIFDLRDSEGDLELCDPSDFSFFEGGFFGPYFAFTAQDSEQAVFAVIDTVEKVQTGGFASPDVSYLVRTKPSGIYIASKYEGVLVNIHPVTGEQTEAAYTNLDITNFDTNGAYTIAVTKDGTLSFFDGKAVQLEQRVNLDTCDFAKIAGNYVAAANRNTPGVQILRLEKHPEALLALYDQDYSHMEARFSPADNTIMLFRYDSFRIYSRTGSLLAETEIPDADQVNDQQFRRDENGGQLDVIYNSGLVRSYSASDGRLLSETEGEAPDEYLYDEYLTDHLRITSPLHGIPAAYDRETGELVRELESNDYLTYVTQSGPYLITEYINTHSERYGLLLDENCQVLARLPQLCDVLDDGTLLFDDMRGNLRQCRIYSTQDLIDFAKK